MLGKADATPMIAVKDIDRARKFYEDTLGLETKDEMGGEVLKMKSGDTVINVYRSEFAGTNKATALTFDVDDIGAEVRELKDKGVFFEIRHAGPGEAGRPLRRRGHEDDLVQGSRRQHPEPVRGQGRSLAAAGRLPDSPLPV